MSYHRPETINHFHRRYDNILYPVDHTPFISGWYNPNNTLLAAEPGTKWTATGANLHLK